MDWTEQEIEAAWKKGEVVEKYNAAKWRKDVWGAWISRDQYGQTDSVYGWQIDQLNPAANGHARDISNLRPLQWKNQMDKQEGKSSGSVTAFGGDNINLDQLGKA